MKKGFFTLIISFVILILFVNPISAQQYEYDANKYKTFLNADEFYKQLDKKVYNEFKEATYSIRKKMLYKDTPDEMMIFEKKTGRYYGQPKDELAPAIHPDRQVYFLASFVQTKDKEYWKHTIIDAETKKPLQGGSSYNSFNNPYE